MDKTTQLMIRACKSLNPQQRLRTVYRRFYYRGDSVGQENAALVSILSRVCEEYAPIRLTVLMDHLKPENHWKHDFEVREGFNSYAVKILSRHLRMTEGSDLDGLTPPRRFRDEG